MFTTHRHRKVNKTDWVCWAAPHRDDVEVVEEEEFSIVCFRFICFVAVRFIILVT